MEIALISIALTSIVSLSYIIYMQLLTIKELAKLIKSDNLQEYENLDRELPNQIKVWQQNERFKDISEMSDSELKDINVDPNTIYSWFTWDKSKTENFTQ